MPKFKRKIKLNLHKPSMETVMQWIITLLLGFIVLLPAFAGVTQYEQNRAKADAEDILAFMQTSCRKYDNYRLGDTTEALQDALSSDSSVLDAGGDEAAASSQEAGDAQAEDEEAENAETEAQSNSEG